MKYLLKAGIGITILYIFLIAIYICSNFEKIITLDPNSLGDFMAGSFSGLAFFWLVLGFFLQSNELKNAVEEQSKIALSTQKQLKLLEQQLKNERNDTAYDAFQRFAERMQALRTLEMQFPNIRKIWENGQEGKALEKFQYPEHFYFAKMLLQANEALFLAFNDEDIPTDGKGFNLEGWRENFKTDLSAPKFRNIWLDNEIVRKSYDIKFQNEVDKLIREILEQ